MVFREFIKHTFQFLVEAVLHIISFIFCWSKKVPLTIKINDRVTWEYGSADKFSIIFLQQTAGIVSVLVPSCSCQEKNKNLFYTG
jgi:hypothetical protein